MKNASLEQACVKAMVILHSLLLLGQQKQGMVKVIARWIQAGNDDSKYDKNGIAKIKLDIDPALT